MSFFRVHDLGLGDYVETHALQKSVVDRKRKDRSADDVLLLVEHPDVYTAGRKSRLVTTDIAVTEVERGGEVTFHNPGQLVAYPILSLAEDERDLHLHLRRLEQTLIDCLSEFGLPAERRAGATGVWVSDGERKIASVGVAVSGWTTYHGCALNVENDLSGFLEVNPCGFPGEVMTSLRGELGYSPGMFAVKEAFVRSFAINFGRFLLDDSVAGAVSGTILR